MPRLTIVIGNIGSGKSEWARHQCRVTGAVYLNNDTLVEMVNAGDYGRYDKRKKEIMLAAEHSILAAALGAGLDVVVDRTNMTRAGRARWIEQARHMLYPTDNPLVIEVVDFGRGSVEGLGRRQRDCRGVSPGRWREVWTRYREEYEAAEHGEGFAVIQYMAECRPRPRVHAFDFDGTIVENAYPEIGEIRPDTLDLMCRLWSDPNNRIVIWTCRQGAALAQARQFLIDNGIPFDWINENRVCAFGDGGRKMFADVYYDDRAIDMRADPFDDPALLPERMAL